MDNPNPEIKVVERSVVSESFGDADTLKKSIYEALRDIRDPEHPNTLEELSVITPASVTVVDPTDERSGRILIKFAPTVPHCSMASLIGLSVRAQIETLGVACKNYKIGVEVEEGTHDTDKEISKQLNDKERVAAALENPNLRNLVNDCLRGVAHMREHDCSNHVH